MAAKRRKSEFMNYSKKSNNSKSLSLQQTQRHSKLIRENSEFDSDLQTFGMKKRQYTKWLQKQKRECESDEQEDSTDIINQLGQELKKSKEDVILNSQKIREVNHNFPVLGVINKPNLNNHNNLIENQSTGNGDDSDNYDYHKLYKHRGDERYYHRFVFWNDYKKWNRRKKANNLNLLAKEAKGVKKNDWKYCEKPFYGRFDLNENDKKDIYTMKNIYRLSIQKMKQINHLYEPWNLPNSCHKSQHYNFKRSPLKRLQWKRDFRNQKRKMIHSKLKEKEITIYNKF
jgi:hypothetical protein